MNQYLVDANGDPQRCTFEEYCKCVTKSNERRVKRETIGEADISTVFLGLDHAWDGGPPLVWETMVFGGKLDQEQDRCGGNRKNAEAMHARMVARVKEEQNPVAP